VRIPPTKNMRFYIIENETQLVVNQSYEGETIETKVERITTQKEPIKDASPLIYTDRKDGVQPAYDVRTDRFEIAIDAMDKVNKSHLAKREQKVKERAEEQNDSPTIQATENN
jgi:hypothetical protein